MQLLNSNFGMKQNECGKVRSSYKIYLSYYQVQKFW